MLRTPPSSRKRARLLEHSSGHTPGDEIIPAAADEGQQALDYFRQKAIQNDKDLNSKLQGEIASLTERLQAAEASSKEFEVQQILASGQ